LRHRYYSVDGIAAVVVVAVVVAAVVASSLDNLLEDGAYHYLTNRKVSNRKGPTYQKSMTE
jgi:hypothetical protein